MGSAIQDDQKRFPLFDRVKHDHDIKVYIEEQNKSLHAMGFTEHSFAHIGVVADRAAYILDTLGVDDHTIDLALTAAWMHDLGNIMNRVDHSQSGALIAFRMLTEMGFPPEEIGMIVTAIGNHDEGTGVPVSSLAAALILADKSDVRRNRVHNRDQSNFDIHDRVNYSVTKSELRINEDHTVIDLILSVDTRYSSVMDFFEIFMQRMILCRKAAETLGLQFKLTINNQQLI